MDYYSALDDSDKDTNDSDINYNYKDTVNGNLSLSNDNFNIDNSDTESIVSDNSEYEFLNVDENQIRNRKKKYRSEVEKLGVGFTLPATRSRSGRM